MMKNIDVILFGGQSNMQGQSEALTDSAPVLGAYEYKWLTNSLVPLSNPVGENIRYDKTEGYTYFEGVDQDQWLKDHVLAGACYGNTNLVPSFCKHYIEQTKKTVLAVSAAKGSTEIADWMPGSAGYEMLTEKAKAALKHIAEEYTVEHIYFVWLQGESDAVFRKTKAYYKEQITLLGKALKEDLAVEKFGIIRVGKFTNDARDWEIIHAQDEICREHPDFLMLTEIATELNDQSQYMNPFVGGHYSAAGLERLGTEGGLALAKFRNSLDKINP